MRPQARRVILGGLGLALASATPATAHGLAERYTLPIPLGFYLAGAGATVAVSFALLALFARGERSFHDYPRVDLFRWPPIRALAHPALVLIYRAAAVALLLLILAAAFLGRQSPFKNIAPVMVWVIGWVGLAFVSVLVGNVWALLSPWRTLFMWAEALYRRIPSTRQLALDRPWPPWLGAWPAVALFWVFAWMELVWPARDHPRSLGAALVAYSAVTWMGMFAFGREAWLRGADPFAIFFGTLARFAPTELRVTDPAVCRDCPSCEAFRDGCRECYECWSRAAPSHRHLNLRPPAVGLLARAPVSTSVMIFVLLMLSTVTFDGFTETPLWVHIRDALLTPAVQAPLGGAHPATAGAAQDAGFTIALLLFPLTFTSLYLMFTRLMAFAAARPLRLSAAGPGAGLWSGADLDHHFVLTLLPIAIAYHVAHYLPFLLFAGQLVIPLASDPFGRGWDLLGTSLYRIDIGVVSTRFIWYTAVASIVAGHVVSVFLAHVTAMRIFPSPRLARRSQYPMLVLMVAYTVVSLWILAQPVVTPASG